MMQMTAAKSWAYLAASSSNNFTYQLGAVILSNISLLMLCRSSVRSLAAGNAALTAGYKTVIKISDGFEGDLDVNQQHGHLNGWRNADLGWRQS